MNTKSRGILEVLKDVFFLVWMALMSPKGIELIDEIFDLLDLPDPFPDVNGLSFEDDEPTEPLTPRQPSAAGEAATLRFSEQPQGNQAVTGAQMREQRIKAEQAKSQKE